MLSDGQVMNNINYYSLYWIRILDEWEWINYFIFKNCETPNSAFCLIKVNEIRIWENSVCLNQHIPTIFFCLYYEIKIHIIKLQIESIRSTCLNSGVLNVKLARVRDINTISIATIFWCTYMNIWDGYSFAVSQAYMVSRTIH